MQFVTLATPWYLDLMRIASKIASILLVVFASSECTESRDVASDVVQTTPSPELRLPNKGVDRIVGHRTRIQFPSGKMIGYIDDRGVEVIPPLFERAGRFVEGLAPVRHNGRYGYINAKGQWFIDPQFDFATEYDKGIATGFINGHAYVVDTSGTVLHHGPYTKVESIDKGLVMVQTDSTELLVNAKGKVIADKNKSDIKIIDADHILLRNWPSKRGASDCRLVDGEGNTQATIHYVREMFTTRGGSFFVLITRTHDGKGQRSLVVDLSGTELTSISFSSGFKVSGVLRCGLIVAVDTSASEFEYSRVQRLYTPRGDVVWQRPSAWTYTELDGRRILMSNWALRKAELYQYSETLTPILTGHIDSIEVNPRFNCITVVEEDSTRIICNGDLRGTFKGMVSAFDVVHADERHVVIRRGTEPYDDQDLVIYAWGRRDPVLIMTDVDELLFATDSIVAFLQQGRYVVETMKGRVLINTSADSLLANHATSPDYRPWVWRSAETANAISITDQRIGKLLGVDADEQATFKLDSVELRALPSASLVSVVVINRSSDVLQVNAVNATIDMIMEARRGPKYGWTQIEQRGGFECVYDFKPARLPSSSCWIFSVPTYHGSVDVECRVKLVVQMANHDSTLYSNTFRASINPGQFWRRSPANRWGGASTLFY